MPMGTREEGHFHLEDTNPNERSLLVLRFDCDKLPLCSTIIWSKHVIHANNTIFLSVLYLLPCIRPWIPDLIRDSW